MEKPWKVIAAFIGVFIAGAIFGGFFSLRATSGRRMQAPPPPLPGDRALVPLSPGNAARPQVAGPQAPGASRRDPITPTLMRQFTQKLGLSAEQKTKVRPIVERAGEDLLRIRQESLADTARVTDRLYVDVSAVLTPKQREELEKIRRQTEDRVQAERKRRVEAIAVEAANRAAAKSEERLAAPKAPAP
ncbi:MAG: hypothetical protein B9S34_05085 [Opitutia bacterium Tous-C1TDCM]|nr:MAG: hypothetical protein B9S34_05085 [Opitutae bacterium Tous-C1TDCM]